MKITDIAKDKIVEQLDATQSIIKDYPMFLRITAVLEDNIIKHQTYFDYEKRSEDKLLRFQGFDLRVDEDSFSYLKGATLDFSEENNEFFIDNPNMHDHSNINVI